MFFDLIRKQQQISSMCEASILKVDITVNHVRLIVGTHTVTEIDNHLIVPSYLRKAIPAAVAFFSRGNLLILLYFRETCCILLIV